MRKAWRPTEAEIEADFPNLETIYDVSRILNIKTKTLAYLLYGHEKRGNHLYNEFTISKSNCEKRVINAPIKPLKIIQKRLSYVLTCVYFQRPSAHGFLSKKSIKTNALAHSKKRIVFNIDLKDFFPSINFGRVRGMLISKPYSLPPKAATIIAQIACYKNELPQGSPASPIISNMICSKLDRQLQDLAKATKSTYTRYADDITFSTNKSSLDKKIVTTDPAGTISPGIHLNTIINENGFSIHSKKTRLFNKELRCEVTGLTVNKFPNARRTYIKQVRAMIHDVKTNGLEEASKKHFDNYYNRTNKTKQAKDFLAVINGKIQFIKHVRDNKKRENFYINNKIARNTAGKPSSVDSIYNKLNEQFNNISLENAQDITIVTEGKTDILHLRAAWKKFSDDPKYKDMTLSINSRYSQEGEAELRDFYYKTKVKSQKPIICIFDKDTSWAISKFSKKAFMKSKNGIYALALPKPKTWPENQYAIEAYYPHAILTTKDKHGRRVYLTNEFNPDKTLKADNKITTTENITKELKTVHYVYKEEKGKRINIAMSKMNFANNVIVKNIGKATNRFDEFSILFDLINEINDDFCK